jgi:tripartite-type tricarboxylate transporter receptor subunit TctC
VALPDIQASTAQFGMEARGSTVDDLRARIKRDVANWADVIATGGIEKK